MDGISYSKNANKRSVLLNFLISGAVCLVIAMTTNLFAQSSSQSNSSDDTKKSKKKSVTIIKNGEVIYSGDGEDMKEKVGDWKTIDEIIIKADSGARRGVGAVMDRIRKNVRISSTNNTMTVTIDKDGDGDTDRSAVFQFSGDDMRRWGGEFSRAFGHGINQFHFDTKPFENLARSFRFHAPRPPRIPNAPNVWHFDDDDFESKKAEDLAEDANDLSREAEALRKEAEAMRLEAEAMKKRAEAMKLEAEARKNKKSDDKKSDKSDKGKK